MNVVVSGSGFGSVQGTGAVWLGSAYGTVVSWGAVQVVASVASNSTSGTARVQQSGVWSNAVTFNVNTATISTVIPASGIPGTPVTITGSGFGAAQGSGQVWLGTANGVVQSWSDVQVVALVAAGSTSGKAQVLQKGVWSNAVPFDVNTPHLTDITPNSGAALTLVTINGTGFGPSQLTGTVRLGSTDGQVRTWSDTQVVAAVAPDAVSGIVRVNQGGASSNTFAFTVPGAGGSTLTLVPNLLNLVVGDTHTIQAISGTGQAVTGLTWTSSDPTVVSLSSLDPPVLSALAAGRVTITAGGASTEVTVSAVALPLGTVLWSNPGNGSGVTKIVPAVPSPTGVADVFAFQADGTVQAITSEGVTAWTADVSRMRHVGPRGARQVVPDFQGGLVVMEEVETNNDNGFIFSYTKLDGITGQRRPAYIPSDIGFVGDSEFAVHPDGTIFALAAYQFMSVIGIDPTTGTQKFRVTLDDYCNEYVQTRLIIGGDGYAYLPYAYCEVANFKMVNTHLMLLRVDSSGAYEKIAIRDFPGEVQLSVSNIITNADKGILLTWDTRELHPPPSPAIYTNGMAITTGTAVSLNSGPAGPSQWFSLTPVLQAQDGSFVGIMEDIWADPHQYSMIAFDATRNVRWSVAGNYQPQIATADGGVIAQAYDEDTDDYTGAVVTFRPVRQRHGPDGELTQRIHGQGTRTSSRDQ